MNDGHPPFGPVKSGMLQIGEHPSVSIIIWPSVIDERILNTSSMRCRARPTRPIRSPERRVRYHATF